MAVVSVSTENRGWARSSARNVAKLSGVSIVLYVASQGVFRGGRGDRYPARARL